MDKEKNIFIRFFANRQLILSIITVLIAITYIFMLFNLQVIHGKEYREKSERKMLRTEEIIGARGEILDRYGVVLATSKLTHNVVIYRVTSTPEELNRAVLEFVNIMDRNNDKIKTTFPINEKRDAFSFESKDAELKWKSDLKIKEEASFDDVIDIYSKRYSLEDYNKEDKIKIIMVRYEAGLRGYSLFNCITIAEDISDNSWAEIEEKKAIMCGIQTKTSLTRYYPEKELTSHITGYVSKITDEEYKEKKDSGYSLDSYTGKTGIEYSFESFLKGTNGVKKIEIDTYGNVSNEFVSKEDKAGKNVTLTIDYRLQKVAENSLLNIMKEIQTGSPRFIKHEDAISGSVVVVDVNTGEILSLVSYPGYDPNEFVKGISVTKWKEFNDSISKPMYNRAVSGTTAPGSTFKMAVALAGLKNGAIKEDELIRDDGEYQYGYHPKCWIYDRYGLTHGLINVSTAIQVSCNCFFYEVGRRTGINGIIEMAEKLGLDSKTGIEIPGENKGNIAGKGMSSWYLGDTLSAAIGQSYNSYTPVEMARYIAALANGGKVKKLTLIKNIVSEDSDDNISQSKLDEYIEKLTGVKNEEYTLDVNASQLEAVRSGMLAVTSVGGTSYNVFRDMGIQVAGKTGTAEVTSGSSNGIFVGFAPYTKPEIAVVAVIEHRRRRNLCCKCCKTNYG